MAEFRRDVLRKIFIMMWKNLLLRKRHYIQTTMEIILPTTMFVVIVVVNNSQDTDDMEHGSKIVPNTNPKITLTKEMQNSEHKSFMTSIFAGLTIMLLAMSLFILVPPLIKRIVHEKESGIKELLKIMGLPNWINWFAWILDACMATIITVALIVILICIEWNSGSGAIFSNANPFMVFILFMLYGIALIFFCFALSTFFTSPNIALTAGMGLHLLTFYMPFGMIQSNQYKTMPIAKKIALAFMPNACIQQAGNLLLSLEKNDGLQWNNLWNRKDPDDPETMGLYWLMFLVDISIFAFIMYYVDTIKPGKYGVGRKWYFPFELCIQKRNSSDKSDTERNTSARQTIDESLFEDDPSGKPSIEVHNLRKVFSSLTGEDLVAVDNVTFRAFEGQIMALLGHNGAGKSTTFNILTGMYSKTFGDTKINGYDTDSNMDIVRKNLGICPQHNMLFPELTVGEHFTLFGMIKGLSKKEAIIQGNDLIKRLNLEPKHSVITDKLSGGMKRKVNLGISLIGDSTVVMLDEPTSGMDPQARRYTWDLLQTEKKKRTILLTTHFMEEADILGDRIAIMARGQIQCYGTSLFLKRKLGEGYSLRMSLGGNNDEAKVSKLIKKIIPLAEVKSNASGEMIFSLPAQDRKVFGELFEALEKNKIEMDIGNFGLSITTMEDVFLRVGCLAEERYQLKRQQSQIEFQRIKSIERQSRRNSDPTSIEAQPSYTDGASLNTFSDHKAGGQEKLKGLSLLRSRIIGLLTKKVIYTLRKWPLFLLIGLIPMLMAILSQLIINYKILESLNKNDSPDYDSPVNHYNETNVFVYDEVHDWDGGRNSYPLLLTFIAPSELPYPPSRNMDVLTYGIFLTMGMSLLVSLFVIFPIVERTSGAKHLQMMTGLHPVTYWISNLAWDYLIYLFSSVMMLILLMAMDHEKTFTSFQAPGATILIVVMHGIPAILMVYLFSFWLKAPASGFSVVTILELISGMMVAMFVGMSLGFKFDFGQTFNSIVDVLRYSFMFIPTFNFGRAMVIITKVQLEDNYDVCSGTLNTTTLKEFCSHFPANLMTMGREMKYLSCCTSEIMKPKPGICGNTIQNYTQILKLNISTRMQHEINDALKCYTPKGLFSWDPAEGINYDLILFVINTIIFGVLLMSLEKKVFRSLANIVKKSSSLVHDGTNSNLDDDVKSEALRVLNNSTNSKQEDLLSVRNLQKTFGGFRAVQGITFGVNYGECFGFLGINGAGKTTSFKMLTGEEQLTSGEATLSGFTLERETENFLAEIGYCPQFDAIIEQMTGKEMLVLFCRLRGILPNQIEIESQKWIQFLGLAEYADRKCGTYSGGNKRKLSIGIALVADPQIIFFDEPSTGVDPVARRKLWNVISMIRKRGQSVVLTSHSMEECEALCDRLAIMVNGQFQCFGNIPHLKNKFCQGFTVLVKLGKGYGENEYTKDILSRIKETLLIRLSDAVILDEHKEYIEVHVRDINMLWSSMFKIMEGIKDEFLAIEDYSISETSLEQVFISFAKNQKVNQDSNKNKKKGNKDKKENDTEITLQPNLARHFSTMSQVSIQENDYYEDNYVYDLHDN